MIMMMKIANYRRSTTLKITMYRPIDRYSTYTVVRANSYKLVENGKTVESQNSETLI